MEANWDLGEPGGAGSLWYSPVGGGAAQRRGYRTQRLPPNIGNLDRAEGDGEIGLRAPYRGATVVTVLLDSEGPKLLVDGSQRGDAAGGPVTLPLPQFVPDDRDHFFAPLVFTALVVGDGVPPDEVIVEFEQDGQLLETANMRAATDVDAEADCYLFPYPVAQELLLVRATWEDTRGEGREGQFLNTEDGRDMGFLSTALSRLRAVYDDMLITEDLNGGAKLPRRPATEDYKKMASVHRAVLAYTWQNTPFTNGQANAAPLANGSRESRIEDDGRFGPGKRTKLKAAGYEPALDNQPNYKLFDFYKKGIGAVIRITVAGVVWRLVSPSDDRGKAINREFQRRRARLDELFGDGTNSLYNRYTRVEVAMLRGVAAANRGQRDSYRRLGSVDRSADPIAFIRTQINTELGGVGGGAVDGYSDDMPAGLQMRVWGPPLLRRPTQQVTIDRATLGNETEEAKDARAATREAFNGLARDFDACVKSNRGPLRNVAWYDALPRGPLVPFETWRTDGSNPKVPRTISELPRRKNAFATTGILPLAAATCTGAFMPSNGVTESQARARLGGGEKQVDALTRLGLRHTPEAMAAMVAFADLIVHECLRPGGSAAYGVDGDPIDSAVRRAQRHAIAAAKLLRSMYVATERTERLFLRETDPLYMTAPGGRAALVCMRHLPCFQIAIRRDQTSGNRLARMTDRDERDRVDRPLWSRGCRDSASAFAEALGRLGKLDRSPVHPVAFPLLPLQALWTWPQRVALDTVHGTPLVERQRQLAQDSAAAALQAASTVAQTQIHAARLSLARVARMARALGLANDADVRAVLLTTTYARPAAVRAGELDALLALSDRTATPDAALDALLASAAVGARTAPRAGSVAALRTTWARRALDTYSRWRHADVLANNRDDDDDVETALAKLSLVQPADPSERVQTYYAPFGTSPGASPLAGVNPGIGEARVWVRYMTWAPVLDEFADARELVVRPRRCTPYDGVLVDPGRRDAHSHPHMLVLTHADDATPATPASLVVPVALEALDASDVDAIRTIMFTAERMCLAFQCATVHGASLVTIVADDGLTNPDTRTREFDVLSACVALALGMLANTVDRRFGLRYQVDAPVQRMRLEIDGAVAELLAADSSPCLALCEAAAVVAAKVAVLNPQRP